MVIALDVGTSSARAAAYDRTGRRIDHRFHSESYEPRTTHDGGMELDPTRLLGLIAMLATMAILLNEIVRRAEAYFSRWHND